MPRWRKLEVLQEKFIHSKICPFWPLLWPFLQPFPSFLFWVIILCVQKGPITKIVTIAPSLSLWPSHAIAKTQHLTLGTPGVKLFFKNLKKSKCPKFNHPMHYLFMLYESLISWTLMPLSGVSLIFGLDGGLVYARWKGRSIEDSKIRTTQPAAHWIWGAYGIVRSTSRTFGLELDRI